MQRFILAAALLLLVDAKGGGTAGRSYRSGGGYYGTGAYASRSSSRYMLYGVGGGVVYYGATRRSRYGRSYSRHESAAQEQSWRFIRIDLLESHTACAGTSCQRPIDFSQVPDIRFMSVTGEDMPAVGVADESGNSWSAEDAKKLTDGDLRTYCDSCTGTVAVFDLGESAQIASFSVGVPPTTRNADCMTGCTEPLIQIQYNVSVSTTAAAITGSTGWPLLQAATPSPISLSQRQSPELLVEYLSDDFSQFHICPSGYSKSNSTSTSDTVDDDDASSCSSANLAACKFVGPGGQACTSSPAVCNPLTQVSEYWNGYSWQPTCEVCRAISEGNHELDECLKCAEGYHIQQEWEDCSGTCVPDTQPTNSADTHGVNHTLLGCSDLCASAGLGCVGFQWFPATSSNPYAGNTSNGSCWAFPNTGGVPAPIDTTRSSPAPEGQFRYSKDTRATFTAQTWSVPFVDPALWETAGSQSLFCATPGLMDCTVAELCTGGRRLEGNIAGTAEQHGQRYSAAGLASELSYGEFLAVYSADVYGRTQPMAVVTNPAAKQPVREQSAHRVLAGQVLSYTLHALY
jgi:hypothetical protein